MSGLKRGSGERSNSYSESKYTNWSQYNPFDLEISVLPKNLHPTIEIVAGKGVVPIYVRDLHADFIRPVEAEDVRELLSRVPSNFLHSLDGVYLLGGTSKQIRTAKKLLRYGCYSRQYSRYGRGQIYLHAFPRQWLSDYWKQRPKPTIVEQYTRMGAEWKQDSSGWRLEFNESSLRRFYLFNVLLHELGHHVDKRVWNRDSKSAERYAEWFAQEYARSLNNPSATS